MQVRFRGAQLVDAERIACIYVTSRKRPIPYAGLVHTDEAILSWIKQALIPQGGVTVAIVESHIQGFLVVSRSAPFGWIDQLYVDPTSVGLGLGSALVELAKTQVGPPLRVYTFQQNESARRFYRHHGFREIELTDGSANEEKTPDVLMEWP